jgi:hypothetical protein
MNIFRRNKPNEDRPKRSRSGEQMGANPKGSMKEPTQHSSAKNDREDLKSALQELEEKKGDWSKGG